MHDDYPDYRAEDDLSENFLQSIDADHQNTAKQIFIDALDNSGVSLGDVYGGRVYVRKDYWAVDSLGGSRNSAYDDDYLLIVGIRVPHQFAIDLGLVRLDEQIRADREAEADRKDAETVAALKAQLEKVEARRAARKR